MPPVRLEPAATRSRVKHSRSHDKVLVTVQISFTYHLECTGTLPLTKREWRGPAPLPPRFYRSYRSIPWNDN